MEGAGPMRDQPDRATKPVGRDQVVAAILESAADLFAERGPAATSTRDIATAAGVNQALIFRHLGNKQQLVGAVLDHLASTLAAARQDQADQAETMAHVQRQWRVIARALLDGYPVGQLQQRFPGAEELVDQIRRAGGDENDARLAAANIIALHLGWQLFGPFVSSSTGIDSLPESRIRQAVTEASRTLIRGYDSTQ
jgi:TetR/AcrR family transcriptional regulator, repressor for neighboring sulfatase